MSPEEAFDKNKHLIDPLTGLLRNLKRMELSADGSTTGGVGAMGAGGEAWPPQPSAVPKRVSTAAPNPTVHARYFTSAPKTANIMTKNQSQPPAKSSRSAKNDQIPIATMPRIKTR